MPITLYDMICIQDVVVIVSAWWMHRLCALPVCASSMILEESFVKRRGLNDMSRVGRNHIYIIYAVYKSSPQGLSKIYGVYIRFRPTLDMSLVCSWHRTKVRGTGNDTGDDTPGQDRGLL
jgi:hypothetical protein